jgi:hypothetical protein
MPISWRGTAFGEVWTSTSLGGLWELTARNSKSSRQIAVANSPSSDSGTWPMPTQSLDASRRNKKWNDMREYR